MMFEKYDAYKDSGVEWLGKIPANWTCIKMKFLYSDVSIKGRENAELLSVTQDRGVIPRTWVENRMVMPSGNLESFKYIQKGDFAISLRSFEGGLEYCYHDGIISPAYTVLKKKIDDLKEGYYKYLFKSKIFISELQTSIVGIREGKNISYEELRYSYLPIPSEIEQHKIACYLDQKTSEIDQAIAIKQQQIALLNERKQIVIQKAVTQGLNSNVPMKDSGVEWIGQIPEHWETYFNRRLFRENSRPVKGDELPLSLSQKDGVIPSGEMKERSLSPSHRNNFKLCFPNDLVVNRFKGHLGVFFQSNYTGIVTFHYGVFEPAKNVYTKYFELLYHTEQYKTLYAGASNGMSIGLQNLSNLNFYRIKSIVPPLEEQKLICEHADKVENEHNNLIQRLESQIEKLKEYKTTLINDAVTGKIKVA